MSDFDAATCRKEAIESQKGIIKKFIQKKVSEGETCGTIGIDSNMIEIIATWLKSLGFKVRTGLTQSDDVIEMSW
jgi:hypothetical protein